MNSNGTTGSAILSCRHSPTFVEVTDYVTYIFVRSNYFQLHDWLHNYGTSSFTCSFVTHFRCQFERKRIRIADGIARHTGELSLGGRANELIEARLASLPDSTVRALRLIAVAGSLSASDLTSIVGTSVVDDLVSRGLIDERRDGRRRRAVPRHPLYGELMGRSMGDSGRREAAGLLFDAAASRASRRAGDALPLAAPAGRRRAVADLIGPGHTVPTPSSPSSARSTPSPSRSRPSRRSSSPPPRAWP